MVTEGTQIEISNNLAVAEVADRELTGLQMQEILNLSAFCAWTGCKRNIFGNLGGR